MSTPNPLLEPLGPHRAMTAWPRLLESNPLEKFPDNPTDEEREEFVYKIKDCFAVTRAALNTAFDVQYMLRNGYRDRNPCKPENQRRLYAITAYKDSFATKRSVFYSDSQCKIVLGITGTGKSKLINRILSAYPQIAVHGANESAQWLKHTQLVHLTVKMPADGSRGGLLYAILSAIDAVLDTSYFEEYNRRRITIEKLAVKCAQILASLSLGLLVIEEMQAGNFLASKYRKELQLFFLGLLSFGVPLILVGNPLAFGDTDKYTQTQRRFLSREPTELWPYACHTDPDWINAIAPAIWSHQVVDQVEPFSPNVARVLWECSGGIPDFARKLVEEVQLSMLKRTADRLDTAAIERHYRDLHFFHRFRSLIEGLRHRNADLISAHEDIPVEQFQSHWGLENGERPATETAPEEAATPGALDSDAEDPDKWDKLKKRTLQKKKATKTRKRNRKKRSKKTAKSVNKDDLRHPGTAKAALSRGLEKLRDQVEAEDK